MKQVAKRMKLNLTQRLIVLFSVFSVLLVLTIASVVRYSFNKELTEHIHRRELANLQTLADDLADRYAAQGNWQFLPRSPESWHRFVLNSVLEHRNLLPEQAGSPEELKQLRHKLRHQIAKRRQDVHHLMPRLQLVDQDRQRLVGVILPREASLLEQPITIDERTVGYLLLAEPPGVRDELEQRFQQAHFEMLLITSSAALIISFLIAYWLARNLTKPIHQLASTVAHLREGDYLSRSQIQRSDELGQLATDIDQLAETLARNEQFRRNAMADISHELRTPLSLLRSRIEAMQDGVVAMDDSSLEALHRSALRLTHLVDDLHQMALADAGGLKLQYRDVDAVALTQTVVREYEAEMKRRDLELNIDAPDSLMIDADQQRFRQVIDNLISNSIRYTDPNGRITIRLRSEGSQLLWCIEDSEPGVAEADITQLFERFFRVEKSRSRDSGGSGLGLAVVKALVQAHRGSVEAAHSSLGGLQVCLRLPLRAEFNHE